MEIAQTLALAIGLGLLGFVEPCSVGSHLLFVKFLERRSQRERLVQTVIFTLSRAGLMTALGIIAALAGAGLQGLQQSLWMLLGGLYIALGLLYIGGGAGWFIGQTDRLLPRLSTAGGGVGLGAVFGLNIPACAAPLLAVLLGGAAEQAAGGAGIVHGGLSLLVFGLALSSPLVLAVFTEPGRRLLNRVAGWAGHMPRWTGAVLVGLGLWSIALAF